MIFNGVLGGVFLILFNLVGAQFNFTIPLNVISALIVGVLGIPGVLLLIITRYILII